MGRTVIKGADGFFRVSGRPESEYFTDAHHAQMVANNLDAADAAEHEEEAACSDVDVVQPADG